MTKKPFSNASKKIISLITFLVSLPPAFAQRVNFTNYTNSNSTIETFTFINTQADNVLGTGALFGTFIITFIGLKTYFAKQAFAASSFITFIVGLLLWSLDWVGDIWFIASCLMLGVGIVMLIYDSNA